MKNVLASKGQACPKCDGPYMVIIIVVLLIVMVLGVTYG
jgi:hypothetical protein